MMMKTMTRMTRTARNYHSKGLQSLRQTETLTLQYTIAEVEEEDVGSQTADDDTRATIVMATRKRRTMTKMMTDVMTMMMMVMMMANVMT